ncbi:MAG: L,D-transpeptidase family protein [Pseudomonadota bacterium]|nr:L,D-transpeptidase family protein [Pseudomonadota bacterium]
MIRRLGVLAMVVMLIVSVQAQSNSLSQTLEALLKADAIPLSYGEDQVQLSQKPLLIQFYQQRDFQPAWNSTDRSKEFLSQLLHAIDLAAQDGLDPELPAYHKTHIQRLAYSLTIQEHALRDLLLSDAFLSLAQHLHHGVAFQTEADILHRMTKPTRLNLPKLLNSALQTGQISSALAKLAPSHSRYLNLKKQLEHYQNIAQQGGWDSNPESYLKPENVRQRLSITGELQYAIEAHLNSRNTPAITDEFGWNWQHPMPKPKPQDDQLLAAIKEFQTRQNITVDGIVGPQTRMRLAESVQTVINRIRLNLERWRWFNPIEQTNYVMVNIPDFSIQYRPDGQPLSMHAIVGKKRRPTPMMQAQMKYIVLNPYWRIPKTILAEDILPKLQQDNSYLNNNQIRLFNSKDQAERLPLEATQVDWSQVTPNGMLRYIFRQDAGVSNPLGSIKFIFPNSEDIYIHDTSARYLFKNKAFLVSSGCIRAEKPIQLAYEILVREQPEITYDALQQQIQSGQRKVIWLKEKIPMYLTYQTAWSNDNGILYQRKDVYQHDQNLLNFMKTNLKMHLN